MSERKEISQEELKKISEELKVEEEKFEPRRPFKPAPVFRKEYDKIGKAERLLEKAYEMPQEIELSAEEKELSDKIMQEAGAIASAWLPEEFSPDHVDGIHHLSSRTKMPESALGAGAEERLGKSFEFVSSLLEKHEVNELVDIRHMTSFKEENKKVPKKGILGFLGLTESIKSYIDTQTLHSEAVDGGKNEPAMTFTYAHVYKRDYRDVTGSRPKALRVEFYLPESTGRQAKENLESNPIFIRALVERLMKERLLSNPKAWDHNSGKCDPLRPPWEKWDTGPGGGKIYVQQEGHEPGWHDEFVYEIKKQ